MKYQVTKKQCQERIDKLNHVCNRCGRKIVPLKTVNNSGDPTYWAGCMHGQTEEGAWGHFTNGVPKWVYDLAVRIVLEDSYLNIKYNEVKEYGFDYAWENAIYSACEKIHFIEIMKKQKPRYTKKQLIKHYEK